VILTSFITRLFSRRDKEKTTSRRIRGFSKHRNR
jgi:hypothetical protein